MTLFMQRETFTPSLILELAALAVHHHDEITHDPGLALRPDLEHYYALQEAGILRIYTLRDTDRRYSLVGYSLFYVRAHPHFRESLQASQDIIYLTPSHRKGMLGTRFIVWCDAQLQAEGVEIVYQHVSERRDFGKLLTRLGYAKVDTTYARRLN